MRAFFRTMAALTGREDFLYFATARKRGKPPRFKCFCLEDPGFFIFRSGWGSEGSYFSVHGVQVERGLNSAHSHSDAGHLELHVEGEDVLTDSGRYLYGNCGRLDWWRYFASTRAHNTVAVDGAVMGTVPDTPAEVRGVRTFCHRFETSTTVDIVEISHNGYACLPDPVFHLRRVFHFKPGVWLIDDLLTGTGSHEYRLCFNFAPGRLEVDNHGGGAFAYYGKRVEIRGFALLPQGLVTEVLEGRTEPRGGWVSHAYSLKTPSPQLMHIRRGDAPVRFLTALCREGKGEVDRLGGVGDSEIELAVRSLGRSWLVRLASDHFSVDRTS
ncbi:MAG TPA: heparinase II/III-family protein [Spirochaetia bacterium]|nr:heparinase II/III-family protein [Spirochaetia bacterium]